jgi:hypothetical protein
MKAETEAKHICRNAKYHGQYLSWLKSPSACGSDPSEKETVRPDTAVDDLNVERNSIVSSNAEYGVSTTSHGPPALHAVSFVSGRYRGESVFAVSTYRRVTQKKVS